MVSPIMKEYLSIPLMEDTHTLPCRGNKLQGSTYKQTVEKEIFSDSPGYVGHYEIGKCMTIL